MKPLIGRPGVKCRPEKRPAPLLNSRQLGLHRGVDENSITTQPSLPGSAQSAWHAQRCRVQTTAALRYYLKRAAPLLPVKNCPRPMATKDPMGVRDLIATPD